MAEEIRCVNDYVAKGDYIVHAFHLGHGASVKYARVVKVNVENNSITVVGVYRDFSNEWAVNSGMYGIKTPQRVMVIEEDSIPAKAVYMLNQIYSQKVK